MLGREMVTRVRFNDFGIAKKDTRVHFNDLDITKDSVDIQKPLLHHMRVIAEKELKNVSDYREQVWVSD